MEYQLICMSFDGEYVTDHKGTIERCQNASSDMGSKWYFYPWHLIVTKGLIVKEMYGCFINMKTGEPFLNIMFKGRKLSTVQKVFQSIDRWCKANDETGMSAEEYEDEIIKTFYKKYVRLPKPKNWTKTSPT
jgi:hypothetical protein